MISIETAALLKDSGLAWQTATHDFFAVPEAGLDDRIFVLTDIVAYTELIRGWPVVAFHGTAEWALDYVYTSEVIWIPSEEQLRDELATRLYHYAEGRLLLELTADGYTCTIGFDHGSMEFTALTAGEAYAGALLYLLRVEDDVNHV